MHSYGRLSLEEELELGKRVREDGDTQARDTLVLHTLPLVGWMARKYWWSQVEYDDLVQEGTVGLIIAAARWDSSQGFTFSSFAKWWILQTMNRLIMESGIIRIPAHVANEMYKVRRVTNELAIEYGRPPTEVEVVIAAELSEKRVRRALRILHIQVFTPSQSQMPSTSEIDGETLDWFSQLADTETFRADDLLEAREELTGACERLNKLIEALYEEDKISEPHRGVFMRFYGLDGTLRSRTFEAAGEAFDMAKGATCLAIQRIWVRLQDSGIDMDHESVFAELERIKELEKLAHRRVSVD